MSWLAEPLVCPGLFYGTPAQDGYLLRIRVPGGILNVHQGNAIATLLQHSDGQTLQVTNRANLQIRGLQAAPSLELFQSFQHLGLAACNPQVDHLRNVMASPTTGIDVQEWLDVRPWVRSLDDAIQSQPEFAKLPAKFSIGIDGGGLVGIGTRSTLAWEHRYNEIHLSAGPVEGDQIRFHLALGGDKQLWPTDRLIALDDCVMAVRAMASVYGLYLQQVAASQRKARLKHLLAEWGVAGYLQQVDRQFPGLLQIGIAPPKLNPSQSYGHLGIHRQKQPGRVYAGVALPLGQISCQQWQGLWHLAQTLGGGELRLTPWQTVLLPDIDQSRVSELLAGLAEWGLSTSLSQASAAIVACAGQPHCATALTQTQHHALLLTEYLNRHVSLLRPVNIHFTGCRKSCAQPSPAEITLLGTVIDRAGEKVEGYQIFLGARPEVLAQPWAELPFPEVLPAVADILQHYTKSQTAPQTSPVIVDPNHFRDIQDDGLYS